MESTNKIAILGANGKAEISCKRSVRKGISSKILTRNSTNTEKINKNIETIIGDARNFSTIQDLLQGCSAVINAVGQPKMNLTF